jgi:hypothetical protein
MPLYWPESLEDYQLNLRGEECCLEDKTEGTGSDVKGNTESIYIHHQALSWQLQ